MSDWTASDYAAWWGAVVASLALVWNIISALRAGPRIVVRVSPNMQMFPRQPLTGDKSYISITAVNKGTAPTTITHCCGYVTTAGRLFSRRKRRSFIITCHAELGNTVPHVLAPGQEWHNLADQAELEAMVKDGGSYAYLGVIHNQRERPIYERVTFRDS